MRSAFMWVTLRRGWCRRWGRSGPTLLPRNVLQEKTCSLGVPHCARVSVEFTHDIEQIAYDAVIRYGKNRRIGVLVHGHDDLRILHPGQMLDRPRDAEREIDIGRHGLARLPDLGRVGRITCI